MVAEFITGEKDYLSIFPEFSTFYLSSSSAWRETPGLLNSLPFINHETETDGDADIQTA